MTDTATPIKSHPKPPAKAAPTVLVRVRRNASGLLEAELREAADAEAVTAATATGFVKVDVPASDAPAYPKWVYHADGRRQVVQSEADLKTLGDGFQDTPPDEKPEPPPEPHGTPAPKGSPDDHAHRAADHHR